MATLIRGKNPRKPYTVRYWVAGKQREKSFPNRRLASDFKSKVEYEARTQTFVDPKLGDLRFTDYAASVISNMDLADNTRRIYYSVLRNWIGPWAGDRSLRKVANDAKLGMTSAVTSLSPSMTTRSSFPQREAIASL